MSIRKFKEGLALESLSSDPSNPIEGQIYYASGAGARAEGLYFYDGTYWVAVGSGSGGISAWVASKTPAYIVGDVVYYTNNKIYRCITANADSFFDYTKWEELSPNTGTGTGGLNIVSTNITSATTGNFVTGLSGTPIVTAYFWDNSQSKFNLFNSESLNIDINSTNNSIDYDTTSVIFDTNDYIKLIASYSIAVVNASNEFDSGWIVVSAINNTPSSGFHRLTLPAGFSDYPKGITILRNNGSSIYPEDQASRIYLTTATGIYYIIVDTAGWNSTDSFRVVASQTARPVGVSNLLVDAVVGNNADVLIGTASYSTITSAIAAVSDGGVIQLLDRTFTETVVLNKNLTIKGKGYASIINGTFTLSSTYCTIKNLKLAGNITISVGANGNFIRECFKTSTATITDNGAANSILIISE